MTFTSPKNNTVFQIKDDATWPSIVFQLDGAGSYSFSWSINWKTFKKSGQVPATGSRWDATSSVSNFGGTLTVHAQGAGKSASISVKLIGANPTAEQVRQYLASKPDSAGFDKILEHESGMTHFTAQGEPKKSFDNGYGMAQLTNPAPSYEQVWNWKLNIDAALSLFAGKRASAIQYLSQQNRTYTADQLKYETVCRWNGGRYNEWDAKSSAWIRNPNILCDTKTGNIGWDMSDAENKGKTEEVLRKRDASLYSHPPNAGAHWGYSGVCYADRVLG